MVSVKYKMCAGRSENGIKVLYAYPRWWANEADDSLTVFRKSTTGQFLKAAAAAQLLHFLPST